MAAADFTATVKAVGDTALIQITGDLTATSTDAVNEAFRAAAESGKTTYVVSFREEDHLTSTGIAVLINLITAAHDRGMSLRISHPSAHYREVFETMAMAQFAQIFSNEEDAL